MEPSGSISHSESGDGKKFLRLPLVSVIVVNFNYGRYLRAALAKNTIRSRRFLAMANQGVPGFVLRAVEGDFRSGEKSPGRAHAACLNTAARSRAVSASPRLPQGRAEYQVRPALFLGTGIRDLVIVSQKN